MLNDEGDIITEKDYSMITKEVLSRTIYSHKLEKPELYNDTEDETSIGIDLLIANHTFDAYYPLHENFGRREDKNGSYKTNRQLLWENWASPWSLFFYQPLHLIRLYFGEKLSFYFAWLGFYNEWLILPSIAGVMVILYGLLTLDKDIPTYEICNNNATVLMCPPCTYYGCQTWELRQNCNYSKVI